MADAVIGRGYLQVVPKMDKGALDTELSKAGKSGSSTFTSSFSSGMSAKSVAIGNIMSSAVLKGVEKASQAATEVFAGAFANYATFEQLAGGVEKIFNDMDNSRIFKDANNAWRDLNMSANDYMATINDVGAMFSATMGDEAAYDAARKGMKAISDYSSGTGKNLDVLNQKFAMITRATSSYQSIADQFSGILPATSADFLEQAQAAGLLSTEYKKLTEVPIDEYQRALVDMLELGTESLGLYGNTAEETAHTISGAIAGMESAWSNWLTGIADDTADMGQLTDDLVEAIGNVVDNALPRIQAIMARIGPAAADAISGAIHSISPEWGDLFDGVASSIGNVAGKIGEIAERTDASEVLEGIARGLQNIGDALASLDFGPAVDKLLDAIDVLGGFYEDMKNQEAERLVDNGGAFMEFFDESSWNMALDKSGAFRKALDELGISAREYSRISDKAQREVAQSFAKNGGDMEAALDSAGLAVDKYTGKIVESNKVKLRDQYAKVELEDNQLVDAQGHVYTWNGSELLDKDGNAAVNDTELVDAQGNVKTWNGTRLVDKHASVSVTGASAIDNLISRWESWNPTTKFAKAVTSLFGASGGFYDMHANGGFITNGAMSLGIDRYGVNHIVGEAGREWVMTHADGTASVVPIENQRYLKPYAATIAGMIGGGNNYYITLDYKAGDDANKIVRDLGFALRTSAMMEG